MNQRGCTFQNCVKLQKGYITCSALFLCICVFRGNPAVEKTPKKDENMYMQPTYVICVWLDKCVGTWECQQDFLDAQDTFYILDD